MRPLDGKTEVIYAFIRTQEQYRTSKSRGFSTKITEQQNNKKVKYEET